MAKKPITCQCGCVYILKTEEDVNFSAYKDRNSQIVKPWKQEINADIFRCGYCEKVLDRGDE